MAIFNNGEKVTLRGGKTAIINKLLGQGGQGAVYDVTVDGKHYALKWYLPNYLKHINQKEFYNNLCENQTSGSPSSQFLWMLDVSEYKRDSFGYLMELRPDNYSSFTSILNAQKRIKSVKVQLKAAYNICEAFQTLHRAGYSYQDINDGNFFVDVNTGDVLICDNDNVAPYGTWMGMAGKDRYMAPEVVLGTKHAGMESDLFSMAVVLYMLFFISHPLEGRSVHACPCLTTKFMKKFYAEQPVFVYDPQNDSNRPVRGIDNNIITLWPLYPQKLKDLFTRSFTSGLTDAAYRVRENEWIDCFEELMDNLVTCPVCGGEQFYERKLDGKMTFICEDCKSEIRKPFVLLDKTKTKNLFLGVELTERNVSGIISDKIVGRVVESKKHPGLWGIQNLSDETWNATLSNGKTVSAGRDGIIPLFTNSIINFSNKAVEVAI